MMFFNKRVYYYLNVSVIACFVGYRRNWVHWDYWSFGVDQGHACRDIDAPLGTSNKTKPVLELTKEEVQAQILKKSRVKWLQLPRYKSSSSVLNMRSYLCWSFLCLYPSVKAVVRVFLGVFWDLSAVWVSVKSPAAKVITVLPVVTALGVKRAVTVNVQQNRDVLVKVVLTIMTVTWAKNVVWMFVQTQRSVIAITTRNARLEKTAAMDPVQRKPTARLTATKI